MNNLINIANQFKPNGSITNIQEFGHGNINHTFLVSLQNSPRKHFILQRINTLVFLQPELVMQNMTILTKHVSQRLHDSPITNGREWEIPQVLLTPDSRTYFIDTDGSFWRAIAFIEGVQTFNTIQDHNHGYEIGYALGTFHTLISDLRLEELADTLPGFHITPSYLKQYADVKAKYTVPTQCPEVDFCCKFISARANWAHVLENAINQGQLHLRPIHGDPKINNVMINTSTNKAVSIIDLDTVKPGLVHYDIGDCLRSSCNPLGEETQSWKEVFFDIDVCEFVLSGYLSIAQEFLTDNDYKYIYDAIRLITFELGLRFFTDYLAGDIYFQVKYPEQNLARALVQFKLTSSIESQEEKIRQAILDLKLS